MMQVNKKVAILAVLASMFSVQGGSSIVKHLFRVTGAAGAVTLRVGLAGIILMLIHRPKIMKLTLKQWVYILFYGLSIGGMNLLFYYGIQRIPLGVGVTLEFSGPLCLALISSRKITDFIWAVLAGAGILMIVPWTGGHHAIDMTGVFFVATAGISWALYIVAAEKISGKIRNSDAVSCGMLVATLLVLPFGLSRGDLFHLTWEGLGLGFGVAFFASVLPFTLDLISMKKIPGKTFSVLQSLQPAIGAFFGFVFVGEKLSWMQWLAIVCVMTASTGAALCGAEKK